MTARHTLPILAAVLTAWGAAAAPKETPATDFEYTIQNGAVKLTKYKGKARNLVIPETIENSPVTELGEKLFDVNVSLVRVSIPDTVTKIRCWAFASCSNLESVKMSKNIESIDYFCFRRCGKLKAISFPKRVANPDFGIFAHCDSLDTLITDDGEQLLKVGRDVRGEYTVPASIREVVASAFSDAQVKRVIFEEGATHIQRIAFGGCKNLTSVTLPQTLEVIGEGALASCPSLKEVIFLGDYPANGRDLFKESPNVTVYYNPSAQDWEPDADGKWAGHGVPLLPLDKARLAKLKLPPAKPGTPPPAASASLPAAPAAQSSIANPMPAAEFDALYAEKLPHFPPALQKLRIIFTNETAKIDLDRVRVHAAALEDYAVNLDKLPALFANRADLDGVKAADAAKELTYRGEVAPGGIRPELAALSDTYAKRCAAADAKAADAVVALTGKYTNALNASLRELLLKKDIQAAEFYKLEADAADRVRHDAQTGKKNQELGVRN